MGYYTKAVKGVSWVGAFRLSTRVVAFVRTIILARILSPVQFGVFGIASMFITFLEILTETGINVVLIQKKESIHEYIDSAWVVSILRGIIIGSVLLLLAPVVSTFFNSPESKSAIYLISLVPFIRGFINPSIVKLRKELEFKKEFWFRFSVFALDSTVAVVFSLMLRNALGIVCGLIAGAILELILSYAVIKPWPRLVLEWDKVREVISKGKWITSAGIFDFAFSQGDDAVVGRLLGAGPLGIYQVAYKIATLPISEITDVVNRVVFPIYVKISDEPKRLRRAYLKTTTVTTLLSIALGAVLLVFGEFVVRAFLGSQWLGIIPLLKVLVVFGVIKAVVSSSSSLLLALEKQKQVSMITLVSVAGLALTIIPLTANYGLEGAVWSPLIGSIAAIPFALYIVFRSFSSGKHA